MFRKPFCPYKNVLPVGPTSSRVYTYTVTRIVAHGENYEMDLQCDINNQLYKLSIGQKFNLVLAKTLKLDGTAEEKTYNQVMHSITPAR